jgi:hypothetical protein
MIHSIALLESALLDGSPAIVFRVAGDIDPADVEALDRLLPSVAICGPVHLDVSDLRFTCAAFLSWLVRLESAVERAGGRLSMGRAPERLARMLWLVALGVRFRPVVGSRRSASRETVISTR